MTVGEAIKRINEFALHHAIQELPNSERTVEAFEMAIDALEIVSKIVQCGECYYKEEKRIMDEDKLWCRKHHMYVIADWFCADGE